MCLMCMPLISRPGIVDFYLLCCSKVLNARCLMPHDIRKETKRIWKTFFYYVHSLPLFIRPTFLIMWMDIWRMNWRGKITIERTISINGLLCTKPFKCALFNTFEGHFLFSEWLIFNVFWICVSMLNKLGIANQFIMSDSMYFTCLYEEKKHSFFCCLFENIIR